MMAGIGKVHPAINNNNSEQKSKDGHKQNSRISHSIKYLISSF